MRSLITALVATIGLAGCGLFGGGDRAPQVGAPATAATAGQPSTGELVDVTATRARQAAVEAERLAYTAPTGNPPGALDRQIPQRPAAVFDQVQRSLRDAGLRISHLDERAGIIAATYAGDPSAFVDCGSIIARSLRGETRRLDAAAEAISIRRGSRQESALMERELVLNARMVVRMRPDGEGTRLRSTGTYVLSKRLDAGPQQQVETVAFESGGRGGFVKGTICQPTGALERLAVLSLSS